jgi:hypothetical protein
MDTMLLTKKDIQRYRRHSFIKITAQQEKGLLDLLGIDPGDCYDYTEQDIYQQMVNYLNENPAPEEDSESDSLSPWIRCKREKNLGVTG